MSPLPASARRARLVIALIAAVACGRGGGDARGQAPADTAAAGWLARAAEHPAIASWLVLRAAGATPDSAARSALYARVVLRLARTRIPWTEAAARERWGDTTGAIAAYRAVGAPITAMRLEAAVAHADASRDLIRHAMLAFADTVRSPSGAREIVTVFDRAFAATPVEQLTLARAAARGGSWRRARTGFEAAPAASLTSDDRFAYATALDHTGADRRAAEEFARVTAPAPLANAARYQQGRMLLSSGNASAASAVLTRLAASASDSSGAAALALLSDLAVDAGNDARARTLLLELAHRFPQTRYAAPGRFDAAIIALANHQSAAAARELRALAVDQPALALESDYWAGRAWEAAGKRDSAAVAWRRVLARDTTSYYAFRAAERLGTTDLHVAPATLDTPHVAAVDSALARAAALDSLGMSTEASLENDELFRTAPADRTRLIATAAAFAATQQANRAIALGRRALAAYGATPEIFRLMYPVAARETIIEQSRAVSLDPTLVAGLIRQESNFYPKATSAVGARGLMQLMPSVARSIAPAAGIQNWNPALLYEPGPNIAIGVRHLAPLVHGQPSVERALAAYNAGESRIARWARRTGAEDPELFTERIPFAETRDYVKSVLRNRGFYRALYSW